jgi:argininosuccinate lyase
MAAARCSLHLSRLAEEFIIWASQPFGFVTLPDSLSTGSSIMPQKKNPDAAELVRAASGRIGLPDQALMITMKACRWPIPRTCRTTSRRCSRPQPAWRLSVAAMTGMVAEARFRTERMRGAAELATPRQRTRRLAGPSGQHPFREAHHITGSAVKLAESRGIALDQPLEDLKAIDTRIDERVYAALSVELRSRRDAAMAEPPRPR